MRKIDIPPPSVPRLGAPPVSPPPDPSAGETRKLVIPIAPHVAAEVWLPLPMSPAAWEQMMAVLEAMRPGIVKESRTGSEERKTDG